MLVVFIFGWLERAGCEELGGLNIVLHIFNITSVYINFSKYSKLFTSQILAGILFSPYVTFIHLYFGIKKRSHRLNKTSICHYNNNFLNDIFKNNLVKLPPLSLLSFITNRFKTIIIGDSIAAGLNRYRSVWAKYLEPLKI